MSEEKRNILYIDDEYNNIVVFKNNFFRYYNIFTAQSAEKGLEIMKEQDIQLVITDQKMPGMTGVEFLEIVVEKYPNTVRMIITAYSDIDFIIRAINKCGIYHYILKPWDSRDLKITIDNALSRYKLSLENKGLVSKLQDANEQLEDKVRERTHQLKEKNHELNQLVEIKNKLFSIVSHDLRTPLLSLKVFLDVFVKMKDTLNASELKKYGLKVQNNLREVMDLLDNLLNWSVTELNSNKVAIQPIKIKDSLDKNLELMSIAASQKKINLRPSISEEGMTVLGNEDMLHLVLRNLIGNAIKYSNHNDEVSIDVDKNNGQAIIRIKDEGVGISKDSIDSLFDLNNKVVTSGTSKEKGVGLGLRLCKEFIDKQNGEIFVDSDLGKGSVFTFTLPLANGRGI